MSAIDRWEVIECGVDEWFLGRREGETSGDGYSPFEEIGHGPDSRSLAEFLATILNAQERRFLELDERLKRVEDGSVKGLHNSDSLATENVIERLRHSLSVAFGDLLAQGMPTNCPTAELIRASLALVTMPLPPQALGISTASGPIPNCPTCGHLLIMGKGHVCKPKVAVSPTREEAVP